MSLQHTDDLEMAVAALVEPESTGSVTFYAPVIEAIADRLNSWFLLGDATVQADHDVLFKLLREAQSVAVRLDAGVAKLQAGA